MRRGLALLVLALGWSALASAEGLPRYTARPAGTAYGPQGFYEYLPATYGETRAPLIVFLAGRMEAGLGTATSLEWLNNIGLPKEIKEGRWPADRPFVVLSPQHRLYKTCPDADEIHEFIQFAKANYRVDPDRIYLTGASCGARGIADYLAKYGGVDVAAAVVLSGDFRPATARGCALAREVALFGVHGEKDDVIDVNLDHAAFRLFAACPRRRDVQFVIYEGAGHADPFNWMYAPTADYDIYAWMLQFRRSTAPHG